MLMLKISKAHPSHQMCTTITDLGMVGNRDGLSCEMLKTKKLNQNKLRTRLLKKRAAGRLKGLQSVLQVCWNKFWKSPEKV